MSTAPDPTRAEPARRVAVLGGSGLLGSAIARALAQGPFQVTAIARRAQAPKSLRDTAVQYTAVDLERERDLKAVVAAHEVVIDAAAPYALHLVASGGSRAERHPVEHAERRTARLIDLVRRHRVHLVHLGTQLADAPSQSASPAGVQGRMARALFPYFRMKQVMQQQLLEAARGGVAVTLVRPTVCLGPFDAKPRVDCWVPKLLSGQIPASLSQRINVIDTRDVAAAVRAVVVDGGVPGGVVDLCGHNTTTDQLMRVLCDEGGVQAPSLRVPAPLGLLPLLGIEMLWATVRSPSPLPAAVVAMLCEQGWQEPAAAQQELRIVPRSLQATARDTVRWYRDLGYC